jgi:hypothetical protein
MAGSELAAEAGTIDGEEAGRGGEIDEFAHSDASSHGFAGRGVKGRAEGVKKVSTPGSSLADFHFSR